MCAKAETPEPSTERKTPPEVDCPDCGRTFQRIGSHWRADNECQYPPLSEHQKNVLTGVLMGDGWVTRDGSNPRLVCQMINEEFLLYLDELFPRYGTQVSFWRSAEELARSMRETGADPGALAADRSDQYRWRTRRAPVFTEFAEWYETGEKVFPADIRLTPSVLRAWYACDGSYLPSGRITISVSNEYDRTDRIESMFDAVGLPRPSWMKSCRGDCQARWRKEESRAILRWMGDPPPGFARKWGPTPN